MLERIARGVATCLLLTTISPLSLGQPGASGSIELREALARTLDGSPLLIARGFDVAAAEGRLQQSAFGPRPELRLALEDALGTDQYRGIRGAEATVTLGWVLERGVRERIVDAARAGAGVSMADVEIARLDAVAETARRYVDCLLYQARYRNAGTGIARAQEAVDAVRRRVESSRAPAAELARAEAELVRAELRREDYEHELLSAYRRLSAQWGSTEPDFADVAGSLGRMPPLEAFESLLTRIEQNPDLAAFVSRARLAEAELNLARARTRPSWEVSGGIRRLEQGDDWSVVGGLTVPLRMGNANQGRIAETRATLAQVEAAEVAARVRIETELFALYQELRHNIELAARLEADVAPRYETAADEMRRAFELGRSGYLEFRAMESELLEVAYEILDAHADAFYLAIEIERLTGESLSPPALNE